MTRVIIRRTIYLVIIAAFTLLSACGRKGVLMPPEALVPGTVESLQVSQKGESFQVSWSSPSREQGGRPLKDLAGFRLLKRVVAPGGIDCSSCPDSWQLLSSVDLDFPGEVTRNENYFIYLDRGVKPGSTVQYRLLAFSKTGGVSRPATTEPRRKLAAPSAPLLQATALPTAIRLTFVLQPNPEGAKTGVNIYRRQPGEQPSPFPVNATPVTAAEWEDRMPRYGKTYLYSATAVATINNLQVESAPSNEAEILFTMPPLE
jgi:predicted small lipoprotein YifL